MNMDMNAMWLQEQALRYPLGGAGHRRDHHSHCRALRGQGGEVGDRQGRRPHPFFARRENLAVGQTRPPSKIGERIGEVGYWVVWLLGLLAALALLQLDAIVAPLNDMVQQFLLTCRTWSAPRSSSSSALRSPRSCGAWWKRWFRPPSLTGACSRGRDAHAARAGPRASAGHPGVHADHHPGGDRRA